MQLPPSVVCLVREGVELGEANDRVFMRTGSKRTDGAVGILTHGLIDRTKYYQHALVLALAPFVNSGLYGSSMAVEQGNQQSIGP